MGQTNVVQARPFVKWVGSKRSVLTVLLARLPKHMDAYYEPFLGGGSLFFALVSKGRIRWAHLSDDNERLVVAYGLVRNDQPLVVVGEVCPTDPALVDKGKEQATAP